MMSDDGWLVTGPTSPDVVRGHYDGWAAGYDDDLAAWGYDAPVRVARRLIDGAPAAVFDAGCGTGLVAAALRSLGFAGTIVGGDVSEPSLAVAAQRNAYDELHVVDLAQPLAFDTGRFDAACCVGVLTYVPDTEAIWRELARVVRPGGLVACTQRSDVWSERRCAIVLDRLERDRVWVATELTPARPYMPGNPDFADRIGVRYVTCRVTS
jgi:predicted TPR repeat methyltransferase